MLLIRRAIPRLAAIQDRLLRAAGHCPDHHGHHSRPWRGRRRLPEYHKFLFNPDVVKTLNGVAQWGVMLFVMLAGIELDLKKTWQYRRESVTTAGLSLTMPLMFGCAAARC
jgi:Kef-type K+ transport system membrane component KefB